MLPIQVATEHEHSHFIVHHLLKQDLPIDIKEKVKAKVQEHKYSWNHIVSNTDDMYYPVVSKILQQCTQPQVLALAHVEGPGGRIALCTATPMDTQVHVHEGLHVDFASTKMHHYDLEACCLTLSALLIEFQQKCDIFGKLLPVTEFIKCVVSAISG